MAVVVPDALVACWKPIDDVEDRIKWQDGQCTKQWAETDLAFNEEGS